MPEGMDASQIKLQRRDSDEDRQYRAINEILSDMVDDIRDIIADVKDESTLAGYDGTQFKKMLADLRNQGRVKWKHVMHLIRLLLSGIVVLREGYVPVRVDQHREQLLSIKRGEIPWNEVEQWRLSLQLHKLVGIA